uniref:FAM193 C-terminal domain-containing protein n=1 Tax=Romanomermis culicivorax TaxID=13658 RepID=A0A915KLC3_ROMCU
EVFAPKNLDYYLLDDVDKEVEYFKKFVSDSCPAKLKKKIRVDSNLLLSEGVKCSSAYLNWGYDGRRLIDYRSLLKLCHSKNRIDQLLGLENLINTGVLHDYKLQQICQTSDCAILAALILKKFSLKKILKEKIPLQVNENLEQEIRLLLEMLNSTTVDQRLKYFTNLALEKLPDVSANDLEAFYTLINDNYYASPSSFTKDNYHKRLLLYVKALEAQSTNKNQCKLMANLKIFEILRRLWNLEQENMQILILKVLANISLDEELSDFFRFTGWLAILEDCLQNSRKIQFNLLSKKILYNLVQDRRCKFRDCVYLIDNDNLDRFTRKLFTLHLEKCECKTVRHNLLYTRSLIDNDNLDMLTTKILNLHQQKCECKLKNFRSTKQPMLDVIFIHGLRGGLFYTWRQKDAPKNATVNEKSSPQRTPCWPKDWLPYDVNQPVRVLAVDYDSYLSNWLPKCPDVKIKFTIFWCKVEFYRMIFSTRHTLNYRSKDMLKKLRQAGVGERPVIFVAHSMGGLAVKKMLNLMYDEEEGHLWADYDAVLENTKASNLRLYTFCPKVITLHFLPQIYIRRHVIENYRFPARPA